MILVCAMIFIHILNICIDPLPYEQSLEEDGQFIFKDKDYNIVLENVYDQSQKYLVRGENIIDVS